MRKVFSPFEANSLPTIKKMKDDTHMYVQGYIPEIVIDLH